MQPPSVSTTPAVPLLARAATTVSTALNHARTVPVGRVVIIFLVGAWLAVGLSVALGVGRLDAAASVAALCLVLMLLALALWDLAVRWGLLSLPQPLGPGPQTWLPQVLVALSPWLLIAAGLGLGHYFWQ